MKRVYGVALMVGAIVLFVAVYLHAQETPQPTPQSPVISVPGTPQAVNPEKPNQAAVSVKEVISPAAPSHYTDQAIWAIMVSFVLRYLTKKHWFRFLNEDSAPRLKAQFGFVTALLTAAGIHFAVTGNVLDGGAAITISGISLDAFKDLAWQWTAQQTAYQMVVKEAK